MNRRLAAVLLLCMTSGADAQVAPDADAWGEPVESVHYERPRVCDMAALALNRDRQIAVIRAAWKKTP